MPRTPRIIVCGAGLTGLTTAWHLHRAGAQVTIIEAGDTVGGVMQTVKRDGFLVERGPNSCTLTSDLADLVDAVGLTSQLRVAAPHAQRRYIVRNGRPVLVPSSPTELLQSPLFSFSAKCRLLAEPFVGRRVGADDETVASFVQRRLGVEPLTWAVDPFVSGVYAGDPAQLSVRHAFPRLAAMESEHGSLLRAAFAGARQRRGHTGAPSARHTMVSFTTGLGTLPLAIAAALGPSRILTGTRAIAISENDGATELVIERGGVRSTLTADLVISTVPLPALTSIDLPAEANRAVRQLATVQYPPVASLALGFRRADVRHPLDGFGCLVPSAEEKKTLGVLFSSTLFPGRAPQGYVLLTCFLGGVRLPALGTASTPSLLDLVEPELNAFFGVTGVPKFVMHTSWPRAIPQFTPGYDANLRAAESIEALLPGVIVDGQFRRGVSVGDCITGGKAIAARAMARATARAEVRVSRSVAGSIGNVESSAHGSTSSSAAVA